MLADPECNKEQAEDYVVLWWRARRGRPGVEGPDEQIKVTDADGGAGDTTDGRRKGGRERGGEVERQSLRGEREETERQTHERSLK